jgi:hypothetical protein
MTNTTNQISEYLNKNVELSRPDADYLIKMLKLAMDKKTFVDKGTYKELRGIIRNMKKNGDKRE